jgi:hypothetical protein
MKAAAAAHRSNALVSASMCLVRVRRAVILLVHDLLNTSHFTSQTWELMPIALYHCSNTRRWFVACVTATWSVVTTRVLLDLPYCGLIKIILRPLKVVNSPIRAFR